MSTTRPRPPPVPMLGHVTSSYYSVNLGRSIALGVVKGGRAREDDVVYVASCWRALDRGTDRETVFL